MSLKQYTLACIFLPALLLLGTPLRAQQDATGITTQDRALEISVGLSGVHRFEQPRLLLKKTIGKNILRGSFHLNVDLQQHPQILPLQCNRDSRSTSEFTMEPGFGLERRWTIKNKLSLFYGAEVRLRIERNGSRFRQREAARCYGFESERIFTDQTWNIGPSLKPFIGLRLQASQKFAFSMEVGPSFGYTYTNYSTYRREYLEGSNGDDYDLETSASTDSGMHQILLFTRPFLSIGYTL